MASTATQTKIYANAFNLMIEIGPIKLTKICNFFPEIKTTWQAKLPDFLAAGIDRKTAEQIVSKRSAIDPQAEYELLQKHGIEVLLINDENYPKPLKEIPAAPPILYVRGNVRALSANLLAVVGTRKITPYGKHVVQELISSLAVSGLNVVSGLAFGVDFEALKTAIEQSMTPVAVLVTPIDDDSISPKVNFNLAQEVIKTGCLVSEYPLNANVQKMNFPIRNRIISGLSIGTLVIEADQESGSLITANYALEQNRQVFAVPGPIFSPASRGTNNLIKAGAKLVVHANDILEELNIEPVDGHLELPDLESAEESAIIGSMQREPIHIDELIKLIDLPASKVASTLSILELKGRVKNLGGSTYVKVR